MSQGICKAFNLGDGWFKSSFSGPNGNSVIVKVGATGMIIGDDKPGRDGLFGEVGFEDWHRLTTVARRGRFDNMNYDQVGVEWFGEYATFEDKPRYVPLEISQFLLAVKRGQLTREALTEQAALAG
jgi:hypothetical protein